MLRKWVGKFCTRFDVSMLYETRVGIKCSNSLMSSDRFECFASRDVQLVEAGDLQLGFDGLRDEFSLLGVALPDSPHVDLMRRMQENTEVSESDYFRRLRLGTLDFRPARPVREKNMASRRKRFIEVRSGIEAGEDEPIKVFRVAGAYFIADGKHRAAVCALLGRIVRCRDVTLALHDSFYGWVFRRMKKTPDRFQRHLHWFEAAAAATRPDQP